ncbi:hypothetical protein HA402_004660 [Bradysia odoriphaga]|nr:hypothetical protein HA402_004660 [Bradysia odoriphaga]
MDSSDQIEIVKTITDSSGAETYLILHNNEFRYKLSDMAGDDDEGVFFKGKKHRIGTSKASLDATSIPSASSWSSDQKVRFNIHFKSKILTSSNESECTYIFGSNPRDTKDMPEICQQLLKADLLNGDNIETNQLSIQKLFTKAKNYQLYLNEPSTEDFVKALLDIYNEDSTSRVKLCFGFADMVLTRTVKGCKYTFCVIEMKGVNAYDPFYREKCRTQLSACMVSAAVDNHKRLILMDERKRATIKDSYIDAILQKNYTNMPELEIDEVLPIDPYCDREFLNPKVRPLLIKSFHSLINQNFEG